MVVLAEYSAKGKTLILTDYSKPTTFLKPRNQFKIIKLDLDVLKVFVSIEPQNKKWEFTFQPKVNGVGSDPSPP